MMAWIRRCVYRMGFRPKLGSIFHSPSYISIKEFRKAVNSVQFPVLLYPPSMKVIPVSRLADCVWCGVTAENCFKWIPNKCCPLHHHEEIPL